jgi:HEAT repeat protein
MGRLTTSTRRRAVADAVLAAGEPAIAELERQLLSGEQLLDEAFLREISYVLVHTPASRALPIVEKLLRAPDVQVRREMVGVLGRFKDPQTDELCLSVLGDSDPEIRSSALDTLVRRGHPELATSILERATHLPDFSDRSLAEKRRVFAAVAKLGGAAALDLFVPLLRLDERRWFAGKMEREGLEALIHGIRLVGTEESRKLLREIADKGNRAVRAVALKALEGKA